MARWSLFYFFRHGQGQQYSRIAPSTTSDGEIEKRHLIDQNNDDSSDYSDSLPFHIIESRRPRRRHRLIAILLFIFITSATSIFSYLHYSNSKQAYSALPIYPPLFNSDNAFTEEALEMWISQGRLPTTSHNVDFSKHTRLDGITFWVNGSDSRHAAARNRFASDVTRLDMNPIQTRSLDQDLQNTDQRYREQNELLYNLRSSKKNLKNLGTLHVVATDFWDDGKDQVDGIQDRRFDGRRGQVPAWLDMSSEEVAFGGEVTKNTPALRLHHDWETFAPLVKTKEDIIAWKERRLPSFNSIAAEAVLGVNLSGLADYSILSSDDMFLGQEMTTADFVSPLYGPVLHFKWKQLFEPVEKQTFLGVEFTGIEYSISLMKKRFGTRLFPYLHHIHKTLSKPLLIESRMMWKEAFEEASSKRFRGNGVSANSHTLSYGLIIERHREALLWSFLVAKLDVNGDGKLNKAEKKRGFKLMGTNGKTDIVGIMRKRSTMTPGNIDNNMDSVSFPRPKVSKYLYSSFDGHLINQPTSQFTKDTDYSLREGPFLSYSRKDETPRQQARFTAEYCRVSMKTCWPKTDNINKIFTHFAFKEPACGDCLVAHLVSQSGEAGLEAFLPEDGLSEMKSKRKSAVPDWVPAHLPIGNDWEKLKFSLSSIASINRPGWSRRAFSIHLIQRYNYIAGDSDLRFMMLTGPESAKDISRDLLRDRPAFICLNDDIDHNYSETRTIMDTFFNTMWPSNTSRLSFEKAQSPQLNTL